MSWDDLMAGLAASVEEELSSATPITYVKVNGVGNINRTTGVRAELTTEISTRAVRSMEVIDMIGSTNARVARVRYIIKAANLATRPEPGDRVIDGANTYQVTAVSLQVDKTIYAIDAQRPLTVL